MAYFLQQIYFTFPYNLYSIFGPIILLGFVNVIIDHDVIVIMGDLKKSYGKSLFIYI